MSRVEHIGDAVLYLGDCREILPTLGKVDAVVTDPPYGIDYGRAGGFSASHRWSDNRQKVEWDRERPAKEIFDLILSCSRRQLIWGGNYFTDYLPPTMQWLVWDKVQRGFSLADCEFAWSSEKKASRIFTYARGNESGFAPRGADWPNAHPTQKPIGVMKWCLGFTTGTVVDPFMGSGSTGVACAKLGRKFIGIEIEPKYFDIACRRIEAAYKQPDLFIEKPAPAKQEVFDGL
jgi:DNA modification methylase